MHKTRNILPLILLASLMSLGSCVNEVKNPVDQGPPIDTNYLHGFTRVKISFSGVGQYHYVFNYYGRDSSRQDSIVPTNQIPHIGDTTLRISWQGRGFHVLRDTGYSHSDSPLVYNSVIQKYNYFQEIKGKISSQSTMIDTLSDVFSEYIYLNAQHTYEDRHESESIAFRALPLSVMNSDILTFSFAGKNLEEKIIDVQSDYFDEDTSGLIYASDNLQSILWNSGMPTLTVAFYK